MRLLPPPTDTFFQSPADMLSASAATAEGVRGVSLERFPSTRYQGSKRKLSRAIVDALSNFDFTSVLDAFGGTGAVAHALKRAGKAVSYNDVLAFNHQIGLALIENSDVRLPLDVMQTIGNRRPGIRYPSFIERTFGGIYFTTEENRWLDVAVTNIRELSCPFPRAIAWFALFQSALAKRPYNLFHRRNLYMRTASVVRSFGNKASWDRGFADHFAAFAAEANAAVFDSGRSCRATCCDVMELDPGYDLVYIDTPYINRAGGGVDYRDFYHFLEGMLHYDDWPAMIDVKSKHRRLLRCKDPWSDPAKCHEMFRRLFVRFKDSILAVSYRSNGIPSIGELTKMLEEVYARVRVRELGRHQYALSTTTTTREMLLIATDD